jgi:hypothetical protein
MFVSWMVQAPTNLGFVHAAVSGTLTMTKYEPSWMGPGPILTAVWGGLERKG